MYKIIVEFFQFFLLLFKTLNFRLNDKWSWIDFTWNKLDTSAYLLWCTVQADWNDDHEVLYSLYW